MTIFNKRFQGKYYEEKAEHFLTLQKYTTVARNFYYRSSEIDLVMLSPEQILVFVEVKFRSHHHENNFHPWESLSRKKQQNLFRAATGFLNKNPDFAYHYSRFDAVIITSTPNSEKDHIEHFPDAFREIS